MLKRWRPAAAGLLRDANGNCWGGAPPPASWVTTRTERGLHHPRGRRVTTRTERGLHRPRGRPVSRAGSCVGLASASRFDLHYFSASKTNTEVKKT